MPGNSTRMLDLRLAERALKGEGRLALTSGRVSGQIKRQGYTRDRVTRHIEKERRAARDRFNLQERQFLSEQMFRKDLNPFLVVFRSRYVGGEAGRVCGVVEGVVRQKRCEVCAEGGLSEWEERLPDVLRLPDLPTDLPRPGRKAGHVRHTSQGLERLPELSLDRTKSVLRTPTTLLRTPTYPKSLTYVKTSQGHLSPVVKVTQSVEPQETPIKRSKTMNLKRSKTVTFLNEATGVRHSTLDVPLDQSEASSPVPPMTVLTGPEPPNPSSEGSSTVTTSSEGTSRERSPTPSLPPLRTPPSGTHTSRSQLQHPRVTLPKIPHVDSARSPAWRPNYPNPRHPQVKTYYDCPGPRHPQVKTYSDVVTDICRALGPGEAQMAERKRVEAEDAEGITERKSELLTRWRSEAEQDVFRDTRWKGLMDTLYIPRGQ